MMSRPDDKEADSSGQAGGARATTCARCTHVNAPGRGTCVKCGAHLHVRCNDCGARNPRVQPRCLECGRTLHRGGFDKLASRVRKKWIGGRKAALWLAVAAGLVGIGWLTIIEISNFTMPAPK